MDKKVVKMAADLMRDLGLTEIKLKDGDTEIEMKRESSRALSNNTSSVKDETLQKSASDAENDEYADVLCPLIGVFHAAPDRGETPFTYVGKKVSKGDVLCIIESMKMHSEITSDYDGTVISVFAGDDTLVEYGQPLFRIALD